ncbi:MAG: hypothetical protein IJR94_01490 [Synergistaceae bacterium]|nr:hypothetical protein [Synergistaceae bacterium]
MNFNFEQLSNNVRSVLRGEAAGSVKFIAAGLIMLSIWVGVSFTNNKLKQSKTALSTQQNRLHTLLLLADEYKSIAPTKKNNSNANTDVAAVFAQVSELMKLGSRVNRITPDGRNQSVEINRLYAEELADLQKNLASRGVRFIAAELRALPAGNERLFTISAIIGPIS